MFLRHALRDGFFHADMHQGNLKVAANGDVVALDFGIMGRLDVYTRRVYAEILMGFIRKDYRRVAEVHFEAGYVPADRASTNSRRRCGRSASRSSAWMPAASRWRGCWPICSR
jgi:predicted unusual protein kinase regulating ubiquinone biosynthesis (AarF/ABC1/UbiB family)